MRALFVFISVFAISFSAVSAEPAKLALDTATSTLTWKGKKVTGEHVGVLKVKDGTLTVENGIPVGGAFELDMATIENHDLKDPAYKAKLEKHLKSDDFFNVTAFPLGKFEITKISPLQVKDGQGTYEVAGNLTIKNISKPIKFPAEITNDGGTLKARGNVTLNRLDWEIRYNSGKFFDIQKLGDKLIYDEIEVGLDLATLATANAG